MSKIPIHSMEIIEHFYQETPTMYLREMSKINGGNGLGCVFELTSEILVQKRPGYCTAL